MKHWITSLIVAMMISLFSFSASGDAASKVKVIKSVGAEFSTYINSSTFQAPSGNLKLRAKTQGTNWYAKLCKPNSNCKVTNAIGPYRNGTFVGTFRNVPKGTYYLHFYKKRDGNWTAMHYRLYQ